MPSTMITMVNEYRENNRVNVQDVDRGTEYEDIVLFIFPRNVFQLSSVDE